MIPRSVACETCFAARSRSPFSGFIGTFMARDALSLAALYLNLTRKDVVLLPAYLCKEVLRPFAGRSQVLFYDIGDDLSADPDVIRRQLDRERVRLLLTINYFGFLQPWREEIGALCRERDVVLLEDCAHSLLTTGSGDTGDLSVVSYRKLLPVFDGGGLRIRKAAPGFVVPYHPRIYSNMLSLLATVKALTHFRSDALSRAGVADRRAAPVEGRPPVKPGKVLPLSWFASNGTANAPVADIVERRRRDYEFWQGLLEGAPSVKPLMPDIDAGVCPLGFPVTAKHRDALKAGLEKAGVPVTVHWRLPGGLSEECSNSLRLSQHMLTLPVYPLLTAGARKRAAEALRA